MSERTPRAALPYILPGQAQKEMFHNEALALIDAALHPAVEGAPLAAPPPAPQEGQCWAVDSGATGGFAGHDGAIAMWTQSGWRFAGPIEGLAAWNKNAGFEIRWDGTGWTAGALSGSAIFVGGVKVVGERLPPVPSPSGGTIIDVEARAAIDQLIATLMSHGLTG